MKRLLAMKGIFAKAFFARKILGGKATVTGVKHGLQRYKKRSATRLYSVFDFYKYYIRREKVCVKSVF